MTRMMPGASPRQRQRVVQEMAGYGSQMSIADPPGSPQNGRMQQPGAQQQSWASSQVMPNAAPVAAQGPSMIGHQPQTVTTGNWETGATQTKPIAAPSFLSEAGKAEWDQMMKNPNDPKYQTHQLQGNAAPVVAHGEMPAQEQNAGGPRANVFGDAWEGVKKIGRTIAKPVEDLVKTTKQAVGLEAKPIPDAAKPVLDPQKLEAMGQYGTAVQTGAQAFTPQKYGADYWQARTIEPTQSRIPMPQSRVEQEVQAPTERVQRPQEGTTAANLAQYAKRQPSSVQTEGQAGSPQLAMPSSAGLPQFTREQPGSLKLTREAGRTTPTRASEAGRTIPMTNEASRSLGTRSLESQQQAPVMPMEGQQPGMTLGRAGNVQGAGAGYEQAIQQEMMRAQQPQNLAAGFNPEMRQKAIELATSGIDLQRDQALAAMKEEQMRSGNFGSSVGQKQMADLAMQYDMQKANAANQVDVRNLEAEREDRYRNLNAEQARAGQVQSLAGTGFNLGMGSAGFQREGMSLDNAATQIEQEYARQGRTIDRNTALQLAQYGREGRDIDWSRQGQEAGFAREGAGIDQATAERMAQFERTGRDTDFSAGMASAGFEREGRMMDQGAQTQEFEADRQGRQINNQLEQTVAALRQQGIQLDNQTLMQLAEFQRQGRGTDLARDERADATDYGRLMDMAQYGQNARGLDYDRDVAAQDREWNRGMQANQFNREGRQIMSGDDWQRYVAGQDEARYRDTVGQFNIGQQDTRDMREYVAYQDAINRLGQYAQPGLTPQSQLAYDQYQQQQADQAARFGATMGMAGKVIDPLMKLAGYGGTSAPRGARR